MSASERTSPAENTGTPSGLPGQDRSLVTGSTPMDDDRGEDVVEGQPGVSTPPGHPAAGDAPVSAGEVLSNHDTGGTGLS